MARKTETLILLEELCRNNSITIKYDSFFGRGGYCRLRDRSFFIINDGLSNETKEQIFINELRLMDINVHDLPDRLKSYFK